MSSHDSRFSATKRWRTRPDGPDALFGGRGNDGKRSLRFLIASGPTREPIDPVRFISNYSTGAMGRYLVSAAKKRGHKVTFVDCLASAATALGLQRKLRALLPAHDVLIMAAAVCDARPIRVSKTKIKKNVLSTIRLVKNPDILKGLSGIKKKKQVFVGFGIESSRLLENGLKKLRQKQLELIAMQKVTNNKTPFGDKPVDVFLLDKGKNCEWFRSLSKKRLAQILVKKAEELSDSKLRDGA